jgi:alpha-mannosidase
MNGMFGCADGDSIQPPNPNRYFNLRTADIVIPYMPAWHLFWDYGVITDCARELGGWEERQALSVATEIVNTFRRGDRKSIDECRKIAQKFLGTKVHSHKVYEGDDDSVLVTGIGHCHIDTAWLWPFDETKRKVARSWATQVDLMERYEEHRFACSQAQQWKWLQQYYPLLFDKVKKKVDEGRFIPIGGTWVEMVHSCRISLITRIRICHPGNRWLDNSCMANDSLNPVSDSGIKRSGFLTLSDTAHNSLSSLVLQE